MTDAFSVTAGLRFTDEEKKLETAQFERLAQIYTVPPTELKKTWTKVSPRFGLEYKIVPEVLAYVSASEGFKSGGFNGRAQNPDGVQPFNPESVWTYEAGLKSEYFDHRVRLNAAVFYNDYKDLQVSASVPGTTPGVLAAVIANAARATIKGVELEAQARAVDDWLFSVSVGYQPSKYNEIAADVTSISTADHLVKTPLWNGAAAAAYTLPFHELGEFRVRADYSFTSTQYFSAKNTSYLSALNPDGSPDTQTRGIAGAVSQHAYGLANVRLIWDEKAGHLSAAAYVTNLANKVYLVNAFDLTQGFGNVLGFPGAPRQWGIQVTDKF